MKAINIPETQVNVAKERREYRAVLALRNKVYQEVYPAIGEQPADIYDFGINTTVFFSTDSQGNVTSSSRLVRDDDQDGLPSETYIEAAIEPYRKQGQRLGEFGKFVNVSSGGNYIAKLHHRAIYSLAANTEIDVVIMVAPNKRKSLYVKWMGAKVLIEDIHQNFGSEQAFSVYAWSIKRTKERFFRWAAINRPAKFNLGSHDLYEEGDK